MGTLPAVPPVPDLDRYAKYTLAADALTLNVAFPLYSTLQEDLTVTVGGNVLSPSSWSLLSASGTPIAQLPLPVTDAYILFSPVMPAGSVVEVIGSFQPKQLSMPTAPGISRREWNQVVGALWSTMREIKRLTAIAPLPAAMSANASGTLANRTAYDGSAAGFVYLQTDDAGQRPVFYVKNSATNADWSQALIVQAPSSTGYPLQARANASHTPITLTGSTAATVMIPSLLQVANGSFGVPGRSIKVKLLGTWTGHPSIDVTAPALGITLAAMSLPPNAGAAADFDAEFIIDAVTSAAQVANSSVHCAVTPFVDGEFDQSSAVNFASGSPVTLALTAQLAAVTDVLVIDRWEVITT